MTELYLFRHGESKINTRPHLISGHSNCSPLTTRGVRQSQSLGRYLSAAQITPTDVYTSPAIRAISTAIHTLSSMGLSMTPPIDEALQEMDQGIWVGHLRDEIYTDSVRLKLAHSGKDFKLPGGESMNEVGERMLQWADACAALSGKSCIFAFTHGIAIRCLASNVCHWTQNQTYTTPTPNTSVTKFTKRHGSWELNYLGLEPPQTRL